MKSMRISLLRKFPQGTWFWRSPVWVGKVKVLLLNSSTSKPLKYLEMREIPKWNPWEYHFWGSSLRKLGFGGHQFELAKWKYFHWIPRPPIHEKSLHWKQYMIEKKNNSWGAKDAPIQFNSIQFNSIQFNSIQFITPLLNWSFYIAV